MSAGQAGTEQHLAPYIANQAGARTNDAIHPPHCLIIARSGLPDLQNHA